MVFEVEAGDVTPGREASNRGQYLLEPSTTYVAGEIATHLKDRTHNPDGGGRPWNNGKRV